MDSNTLSSHSLQRAGASEQIFDILKREIASGSLRPGDRIPSENELAAQFGVSRMTARNALQRLNAIGLVESRVGEGSFVKKFCLSALFGGLTDFISTNNSLEEVQEFRSFFESACLELACVRRQQEDIEKLQQAFERMREVAPSGDITAFNEADMAFHRCICKITGNDVFLMVQYVLQDLIRAQLSASNRLYGKIKGASNDPKDENYILKLLAEDHWKYIVSLQQRDASIAIKDRDWYIDQFRNMKME